MSVEACISLLEEPVPIEGTNILVFYHPKKQEAGDYARHLRTAARYIWPYGELTTQASESTPDGNAEIYNEQVRRSGPPHVVILAGDGGANKVIAGKICSESPADDRRVLVAGAFGHANDLAHGLLSDKHLRNPVLALREGRIARLHWLEVVLEDPEGNSKTHIAQNYADVGLTAMGSQYINSEQYRRVLARRNARDRSLVSSQRQPGMRKRAGQFLISSLNGTRDYVEDARLIQTKVMPSVEPFEIEDLKSGTIATRVGKLLLNNSRMAKTQWMMNGHTFSEQANIANIRSARIDHLVRAIADLRLGREVLKPGEEVSFRVHQTGDKPLLAQFDGEVIELVSGTTVTYRLSEGTQSFASTL